MLREEPFAALASPRAPSDRGEQNLVAEAAELVQDDGRAPELDALEFVLSAPVLRSDAAVAATPRAASIEPWVQEIVKQIAWGGDRRRGAARIELGAGRFAGASVVVQADGNSVSLELAAPPGVEAVALGERLRERLEARGLVVRELSIR